MHPSLEALGHWSTGNYPRPLTLFLKCVHYSHCECFVPPNVTGPGVAFACATSPPETASLYSPPRQFLPAFQDPARGPSASQSHPHGWRHRTAKGLAQGSEKQEVMHEAATRPMGVALWACFQAPGTLSGPQEMPLEMSRAARQERGQTPADHGCFLTCFTGST